MKKIFICILIFSLVFSGCAATDVFNKNLDCTSAGNFDGSMSWNVNGAKTMPAPRWEYHDKNTFSIWYWKDFIVCGDVIYTGGDRLTAVNLNTGKELWETQIKNFLPNENKVTFVLHPVVYGNKIIAIGARLVVEKGFNYYFERRNILVFNKLTGKLLWKSVDIGSKLDYFGGSFPVVVDNRIYVPALNAAYRDTEPGFGLDIACKKEERGVWVWDLNTGKLLNKIFFSFPGGDLCVSDTKIRSYGHNIYIAAGILDSMEKPKKREGGSLYLIAFNTLNNKILWQAKVTDEMASNNGLGINSFSVNSKVVAILQSAAPTKSHGSEDKLKVFDRNSGKLLWEKNRMYGSDISMTENRLFVQPSKDTFMCIDPITGRQLWAYKLYTNKYNSLFASFVTKNVLYLYNLYRIIALDPDTGKELWRKTPLYRPHYQGKIYIFRDMRFIPVNEGFVIAYADFWPSDAMVSPPVIQLWSSGRNNTQ